jgi:hypothetical protein
MTQDELNTIKTRFCSIAPKKMQEIYSASGAAYKLIQSIPLMLAYIAALESKYSENSEVKMRLRLAPNDGT